MTLDQLRSGESARVTTLTGAPLLRERLTELGFLRDRDIQMLRRAPLGDPLYVRIRGGSFAVRRDEARCVTVSAPKPSAPELATLESTGAQSVDAAREPADGVAAA